MVQVVSPVAVYVAGGNARSATKGNGALGDILEQAKKLARDATKINSKGATDLLDADAARQ